MPEVQARVSYVGGECVEGCGRFTKQNMTTHDVELGRQQPLLYAPNAPSSAPPRLLGIPTMFGTTPPLPDTKQQPQQQQPQTEEPTNICIRVMLRLYNAFDAWFDKYDDSTYARP